MPDAGRQLRSCSGTDSDGRGAWLCFILAGHTSRDTNAPRAGPSFLFLRIFGALPRIPCVVLRGRGEGRARRGFRVLRCPPTSSTHARGRAVYSPCSRNENVAFRKQRRMPCAPTPETWHTLDPPPSLCRTLWRWKVARPWSSLGRGGGGGGVRRMSDASFARGNPTL